MTTLDLDALERAARAATPGEWKENGFVVGTTEPTNPLWKKIVAVCRKEDGSGTQADSDNASYLVAVQPTAILSLISDYRALQERVEGAEKALRPFADAYDKHKNRSTSEMGFAATHKAFEEARAYFAARTKAGEPHAEQGGEVE